MYRRIRIPLLLLSILMVIGSGYRMYQLTEAEGLWGYWPLALFSGLWGIVLTTLGLKFSGHPRPINLLGLSTMSGVMLAISFPVLPFTPLIFIAFVPLLLAEDRLYQWKEGAARRATLAYAYNTFVIWNILTTYWVANTAFVAAFVAISLNALFMCVPFLAYHQVRIWLGDRMRWPALIAFWLSFEYLHLNWEISWPWLTLGNYFATFPSWVQWYEVTGVFGGGLWIWLVNILVYQVFVRHREKIEEVDLKAFYPAIALVVIPIAVSLFMYYTYEERGPEVEVVVVQPNFEPHYEKFTYTQKAQIERFIELSKNTLSDSTHYLVFPETSFGGIRATEIGLQTSSVTKKLRELIDDYPHLKLVTGISAQKQLKEGEPHTKSTRSYKTKNREIFWEAYNAAIQIESNQEEIPLYKKSKLVPGPEITPYKDVFFFLKPFIDKLEGTLEGLGTQDKREAFESREGYKVAPVICYESVYGDYSTGYIRHGAQALFVVTNDGWWDNTAGHRQHLVFATLRAIETRRAIARSANTGISAFINQRGDILQPTSYGEATAIKGNIQLNNQYTFYVRYGDIIGRLSVFLTGLLLLQGIFHGIMTRVKANSKQ